VLLAVAAFAVVSLAIGAAYLETMLPGGLPLGNALTALGLCAAAGAAVGLSTRGTVLHVASLVSLLAAAVWLPASVALAGNLALNFGGGRGLAWVVLSLAVFVGVLSTLLWALVASVLATRRRASAA
jgi:hypothetical protein